jgi:hypothetical protein
MGNELDAYVYDYNARGNDGCPLLVLTPVEESCHLFCQGRGGGVTPLQPPLPTGISGGIG